MVKKIKWDKKRIGFLLVVAFVMVFLGISMTWTGLKVVKKTPGTNDMVQSTTVNSGLKVVGGSISEDGTIALDDEKSYIEIKNEKQEEIQSVAIKLTNPAPWQMTMYVCVDDGNGFTDDLYYQKKEDFENVSKKLKTMENVPDDDETKIKLSRQLEKLQTECEKLETKFYSYESVKESDYLCVDIPKGNYPIIRIHVNQETITATQIELHSQKATATLHQISNVGKRIVAGVLLGIIGWLFVFVVDYKWDLSGRIRKNWQRNKKGLLDHICNIVIGVVLAMPISFCLNQCKVSVLLWIFIACILISVIEVICYLRNKQQQVEGPFAIVLFLIGTAMIVLAHVRPFGWDSQLHYMWTLQSSAVHGNIVITEADHQYITNKISIDSSDYWQQVRELDEDNQYAVSEIPSHMQLWYLPGGLVIAVARLLKLGFVCRYNLGRMAQLMVYVLCCYFGMKRLRSGKMILGVVAALPTSIFIATIYSYDYWVICFLLLGIAYFVGMCQDGDEEVNYRDTCIMSVALLLGCMPKQIYMPLMLIPLTMFKRKLKDKRVAYYVICVMAMVLMCASLFLRSTSEVSGGGDTRGGAVNPQEQLTWILDNPVNYAMMVIQMVTAYLNPTGKNVAADWAYLGLLPFSVLFMVLLLCVSITDRNEYDKKAYPLLARLYVVPMLLGELVLIGTAMYLSYTPVGNPTINGCQGRYMLPILYPVCAILFGGGIPLKKKMGKWYDVIVMGIIGYILYYSVYHWMLQSIL